ncbi:MAG: type III-B CRISPR module RAMP protein Cmr1 [Victivallales bacterium]|nr:type III-B CRISPR module RAMP protein Cmr1 [Victivallales bacterium]
MEMLNEKLQIITPCFCAGNDKEKAELRAPSVRGQLRWWFRVLGGSPELEKSVFGGVHDGTAASKVVVRVKNVEAVYGRPNELPQQNSPGYYLFHFANASGKARGARYQNQAWFKPGTSFELECFSRLPMSSEESQLFQEAWDAFIGLGCLGLRQTRGIGAFAQVSPMTFVDVRKNLFAKLNQKGIKLWLATDMNGSILFTNSWLKSLVWLEATLGWIRKNGFSAGKFGDNYTPLGMSSSTQRQASAIHLRPVLTQNGFVSVLYYTPQVLGAFNSAQDKALLNLLNGGQLIKTPYSQRPKMPDDRDEISICKAF